VDSLQKVFWEALTGQIPTCEDVRKPELDRETELGCNWNKGLSWSPGELWSWNSPSGLSPVEAKRLVPSSTINQSLTADCPWGGGTDLRKEPPFGRGQYPEKEGNFWRGNWLFVSGTNTPSCRQMDWVSQTLKLAVGEQEASERWTTAATEVSIPGFCLDNPLLSAFLSFHFPIWIQGSVGAKFLLAYFLWIILISYLINL
jgi:hypothetical protein